MIAGREDAFSLLRKWLSEETELEVRASFPVLSAKARGRITRLGPEEARFESSDGFGGIDFRLDSVITFNYGDVSYSFSETPFQGTLVLLYRDSGSDEKASDTITLSEVTA